MDCWFWENASEIRLLLVTTISAKLISSVTEKGVSVHISQFSLFRFVLLERCEMVIGLIRVDYHNNGARSPFYLTCAKLNNTQK